MPVPTANVFLSFSETAMRSFLRSSELHATGDLSYRFGDGTDETPEPYSLWTDVFTFTNASVDSEGSLQILDFSHELGYAAGHLMTLSFVDPKREFEARIFESSMAEELAAYLPDYSPAESIANPDPEQQQKLLYIAQIPKEIIAASGVQDQFELLKTARDQPGKKVYVTYGVGSNPLSWSGPHLMYMVNAVLDVKGARKITLKLSALPSDVSPMHNLTTGGTPMYLPSNRGLEVVTTGFSRRFNARAFTPESDDWMKWNPTKADEMRKTLLKEAAPEGSWYGLDDPNEKLTTLISIKNKKGQSITQRFDSFEEVVDFHLLITDTIKDFVRKVTGNPNVIVLLPNLNFILRPLIQKYLFQTKWSNNLRQTDLPTFYRRTMTVVDEVCKVLGMDLMKFNRSVGTDTGIESGGGFPEGRVASFKNMEDMDNVLPAYYDWQLTLQSGGEQKDEIISSPAMVLRSFFDTLNKYSLPLYSCDYNVISESQTRLITLWREIGLERNESVESGQRGSDVTFESLLSDKAEKNTAVLVGSVSMIARFLYGQKELSSQHLDEIKEQYAGTALTNVLTGFAHFPIHHGDMALGNQAINTKIRDVVITHDKNILHSAMFGETIKLPDVFAFSDGNPEQEEAFTRLKEKLTKESIPIFKWNTQNPNILKMKANYNPGYWAALTKLSPLRHLTARSSSRGTGITVKNNLSKATKIDELKERVEVDLITEGLDSGEQSVRTLVQEAMKESTGNANIKRAFINPKLTKDLVSLVIAHQLINKDNPLNVAIKVDQVPAEMEASVSFMAFLNSLYRNVNQITITTLPMPFYSNASFLFKECIVLAQFPNVRQSEERDVSPLDTFLSGVYRVSGFKHTISSKKVHSEFHLVKNS